MSFGPAVALGTPGCKCASGRGEGEVVGREGVVGGGCRWWMRVGGGTGFNADLWKESLFRQAADRKEHNSLQSVSDFAAVFFFQRNELQQIRTVVPQCETRRLIPSCDSRKEEVKREKEKKEGWGREGRPL